MMWIARLALNRARGHAKHFGIRVPIDRAVVTYKIERSLARHTYERREAEAALAMIHPGDTVVELGAGLGFLSAFIRKHSGAGLIVTYEANPDLLDIIAKTHRLNGAHDIDVHHGVVLAGSAAATVPFYVHRDLWASSLAPHAQAAKVVEVPVIAWDAMMAGIKPDVVIMDIEGGEADLLGAADLGSISRMVIETHPASCGIDGMAKVYGGLARGGFCNSPKAAIGRVIAVHRSAPPLG